MEHPSNSVEFPGCSIGYPLSVHKELHASSTESPWSFHGTSMVLHGDSVEFEWNVSGSMETPRSSMKFPWKLHGVPCRFHGNSME